MTQRSWWLGSIVVGTGCLLAQAWGLRHTLVDDAWITARYSLHAAEGLGFVYNAGELVEGFSNPLWTALVALGLWLQLDAATVMSSAGLLHALGLPAAALLLTWALADRQLHPVHAAAPLLVGVLPHIGVVATNGLETAQWLLAVPLVLVAALCAEGRWRLGAGLLVGGLGWIRPEGLLVGFLVVLWDAWHHRTALRDPNTWLLPIGAALPVLALLGWRWATYGALVPNTMAAKGTTSLSALWPSHRYYLLERDGALWPIVLAVLGWSSGSLGSRKGSLIGLVSLAVLVPPLQVYLWMPGTRLLLPLWILAVCAGSVALARLESRWPRWILGAAAVAAALMWITPYAGHIRSHNDRHSARVGNAAARMAEWVGQVAPPGATLAVRDAGVVAYHVGTGVRVAETHPRALTVPHPGGRSIEVADVLSAAPELVVTVAHTADAPKPRYPRDRAVLQLGRYRRVARVKQHAARYYTLHVRRDVAVPRFPDDIATERRWDQPRETNGL